MNARDRLLLFIALDGAPRGLDPVRLQKGMFLDAHEPGAPADGTYSFVAYNYGPMSAQIYTDLGELTRTGFIEAVPVKGQSWSRYMATSKGLRDGRRLMQVSISPPESRRLHRIKKEVASKSFKTLLEDVYERYPKYAERSVFRRGE